ncbi:MAG: MarR family transcriptional regulator [Clostridia bacterium]|nr:MarR family transcriptional regulator [Clostridia bacterium]
MLTRYEQFSFTISCIYRQIQKIERDEMIKYGVRGVYAQYLVAMSRFSEGITATQLCEVCDRDKAAISRAISDMEACGLVERKGVSDSNYRAALMLTRKGRKLADVVLERAQTAVDVAGKGLSDEERRVFYAALDLIENNLLSISRTGIPEKKKSEGDAT